MKPQSGKSSTLDADFERFETGRRVVVLHREIASLADLIVVEIDRLATSQTTGVGNRESGFRLTLAGAPEMFVRRARRGGLISALITDLYLGIRPRPLEELRVASEAKRRGIAIADPMGAIVEWAGPVLYRGYFLTRHVAGMTLWDFVRTDDDPIVRRHVLQEAANAIRTMHERGLFHADLNLHNLMVTQAAESFAIKILDLDKSGIYPGPIKDSLRRANIARLIRSARKLDPSGKFFDANALAILQAT